MNQGSVIELNEPTDDVISNLRFFKLVTYFNSTECLDDAAIVEAVKVFKIKTKMFT